MNPGNGYQFPLLAAAMIFAAPSSADVQIAPEVILDQARAYYQGNPAPERINVRVLSDGQTRAEPILIRFDPPGSLFLDLGQYRAWSDGVHLWVVHRLDERGFYQADVEAGDIASALSKTLPPLPLPQITFAGKSPNQKELTPYSPGIEWNKSRIESISGAEQFVISGRNERVAAELAIDSATGRILRMNTDVDDGALKIEIDVSRLEPDEWPERWPDLARRERVEELSELRPRPRDLRIGDALTDLSLMMYIEAGQVPTSIQGPGVAVLFRRWQPGRTPVKAIRAAATAIDGLPGVHVWPILVLTVLDTEPRARIDAAAADIDPLKILHSYSPDASIERFSSSTDQVLVVVDSANIVREIIALPVDPESVDDQVIEAAVRRALVPANPKIKD